MQQTLQKIAAACSKADKNVFIMLLSTQTKLHSTIEKLISKNRKKIFWELTSSDYAQYITQRAREKNISFDPYAIDMLVNLAGENTMELDILLNHIVQHAQRKEQLKNQIKDQRKNQNNLTPEQEQENSNFTPPPLLSIEREDIEQWITHYKTENIFSLFAALSEQRYKVALDILSTLLDSDENTIQCIAGFVYQLRIARQLKLQLLEGFTPDRIFLKLNIRNYTTQKRYRNFVSTTSVEDLEDMICICENTDATLREGFDARYKKILLSKMIYDIIKLHR